MKEKYVYDLKLIHQRLKNLRLNLKDENGKTISQNKLAETLNIVQSRMSKLEDIDNDDTFPSLNDLLAYKNFFNVSIDYLLGFTDEASVEISDQDFFNMYGIKQTSLSNVAVNLNFNNKSNFSRRKKILALNYLLSYEYLDKLLSLLFSYFNFENSQEESLLIIPFNSIEEDKIMNSSIKELQNIEGKNVSVKHGNEFYEEIILSKINKCLYDIRDDFKELENHLGQSFESFSKLFDQTFSNTKLDPSNDNYFMIEVDKNYLNLKRKMKLKIEKRIAKTKEKKQ